MRTQTFTVKISGRSFWESTDPNLTDEIFPPYRTQRQGKGFRAIYEDVTIPQALNIWSRLLSVSDVLEICPEPEDRSTARQMQKDAQRIREQLGKDFWSHSCPRGHHWNPGRLSTSSTVCPSCGWAQDETPDWITDKDQR